MNKQITVLITIWLVVMGSVVLAWEGKKDCPERKDFEMGPFVKLDKPILGPDSQLKFNCPMLKRDVLWAEAGMMSPAAVVRNGKVYLLFRGIQPPDPSNQLHTSLGRIGLAYSEDGRNFTVCPEPVVFPDNDFMKEHEWEGGLEDPHLIETEAGVYYIYYNSFNQKTGQNRICAATSTDLIHWNKQGTIYKNSAKYRDVSCVSGTVVWRPQGQQKIAAKINGKYWMYHGHPDFIATSDNLIDWTPVEDAQGWRLALMANRRPGYFDDGSSEPGSAMVTDQGIHFIYNACSAADSVWSLGQALIDGNDPTRLLERADKPFIYPEYEWEKSPPSSPQGMTDMHSGMVYFKGEWLLYYHDEKYMSLAVYKPGAVQPAKALEKK